MARRSPLQGGAPRLLGDHAGHEGKVYRKAYNALAAEYGPLSELGRMEAGRVAAAWVEFQAASRALHETRRRRRLGRGRRPSVQEIERLARRQGLADSSYSTALERLKSFAGSRKRPPASGLELVQTTSGGRG